MTLRFPEENQIERSKIYNEKSDISNCNRENKPMEANSGKRSPNVCSASKYLEVEK